MASLAHWRGGGWLCRRLCRSRRGGRLGGGEHVAEARDEEAEAQEREPQGRVRLVGIELVAGRRGVIAHRAASQFAAQTKVEESTVEYWPSAGQTAIADSILRLQSANLMFDDLKIERGSLEEVFLHCTGRSLRD